MVHRYMISVAGHGAVGTTPRAVNEPSGQTLGLFESKTQTARGRLRAKGAGGSAPSGARPIVLTARVSAASSPLLPPAELHEDQARASRAVCSQSASDIFAHVETKNCELSSGWQGGCSTKWFKNHCFNSLHRSISSFNTVAVAMMLFRCAVSFAVSCLWLGHLFCATRARLIRALSSQFAREASVLRSLLRQGRSPECVMYLPNFVSDLFNNF